MILIDLEDVQRIHSWSDFNKEAFIHPELTPEEDWEAARDPHWFDIHPDKKYYPGPYLIRVNDEKVWMSRGHENDWRFVVQRFPYESVERRQWMAYLSLYAEGIGVSPRTLLNRLTGMRRRLKRDLDRWYDWGDVYTWPEGSDQVWDGLYEHPYLETHEADGQKRVRHVTR